MFSVQRRCFTMSRARAPALYMLFMRKDAALVRGARFVTITTMRARCSHYCSTLAAAIAQRVPLLTRAPICDAQRVA